MILEMRGITKEYRMGRGTLRVLKPIDFRVEAGEYVTLMGPSGSGKSTLMNILGCLDAPTSGTYRLAGRDVSRLSDDELAVVRNQQLGFVFQTFNLLSVDTALRNVEMPMLYAGVPAEARRRRAAEALTAVGLGHRLHHRPEEMSGGERQRVAIARALINDPAIVLADEPTGNLDSKSGREIMRIFQDLHRAGKTLIVITHDPSVAAFGRRLVRILDGEIVADGPVPAAAEAAAAEVPA